MKQKTKRIISISMACVMLLSLSIVLILSVKGNGTPFTGEAAEYYEGLVDQGFPEDYALSLTKLHLLHPNWSFVPLDVTGTDSTYTWSHVIKKETDAPTTNLVSSSDTYSDYWHATNRQLYDAGYYQPSKATVKYAMDPRNFLSESDIFQFYDLSSGTNASQEAVEAVLAGSFMENATLQNGKSYAEYLMDIGEEIGIDAVYLAVKLRQEQGITGNSPIISGACGDKLWEFYRDQKQYTDTGDVILPPTSGKSESELRALNGLYNPFNLNATGTGVFAIYENAMLYAQKGTPSMSEEWGGAAWDTDWKGIWGGALYIKEKYVDRYQSTVYLQKFNVDGRNPVGNFSNQYMQNVFGAISEGRSFYQAFAANDTLDSACQFLIPVYKNMPTSPCDDPANGACATVAPASARYETSALVTHPKRLRATNDAIYGEISVAAGNPLEIVGEFSHSYGVARLEYSLDGVHWIECSDSGALNLTLSDSLPDYGEYLLLIRGEAAYDANDASRRLSRYFLCAAYHLTLLPPPSVAVVLQSGSAITEKKYYEGDVFSLPVCEDESFAAWIGSDGTILPSGAELTATQDVSYTALFVDYEILEGAALSTSEAEPHLRFTAVIPDAQIQKIAENVTFGAILTHNETETETVTQASKTVTGTSGTVWRVISVDTPSLTHAQYADRFEARFYLQVQYSDMTTKTIYASGTPVKRTAIEVARDALSDKDAGYSASAIGLFESILS